MAQPSGQQGKINLPILIDFPTLCNIGDMEILVVIIQVLVSSELFVITRPFGRVDDVEFADDPGNVCATFAGSRNHDY